MVQKEPEAVLRLQVRPVSLQIIFTELVDHHQHHQLWLAIVCGGAGGNGGKGDEQGSKRERSRDAGAFP